MQYERRTGNGGHVTLTFELLDIDSATVTVAQLVHEKPLLAVVHFLLSCQARVLLKRSCVSCLSDDMQ